MDILLDTNILVTYVRESPLKTYLEEIFNPFKPGNRAFISVVSAGEFLSLSIRNGWGTRKMEQAYSILDDLIIADINSWDVIRRYAEIEAYSQGKLPGNPLGTSARNMGKNDLWIAATASVLGIPLLTLDKDFDHLHNTYLSVLKAR